MDIKYPKQTEFELYRGTNPEELGSKRGKYKKGDSVTVKQNSLSSWTLREEVAREFGATVIKSIFSKNEIFSCFITHSNSGYEAEFLVVGKTDKKGTIVRA